MYDEKRVSPIGFRRYSLQHTYVIRDQDGTDRDFESLYQQYFPDILNYLVHCVGSVADAEDLAAQVFMKAMKNLWRFRWNRGSFSSWLFRIAHNEMKSFYRKRQRGELAGFTDSFFEMNGALCQEVERAEQDRMQHRFYLHLQEKMSELPSEEQSLLVMRFFQGKSYGELGDIFRIRKGTLAMRIHRSLKKLKKQLDLEGLDHEEFKRSFESLSQA